MSATDQAVSTTRTVASVVGGKALQDTAPGGNLTSTNPAPTDEVAAEVLLGDAGTYLEACRAAREARREWAAVPAPIRSQVVKKIGRIAENSYLGYLHDLTVR